MPRKSDSLQTHRRDPADSHGGPPGGFRGLPCERTEADTWLDNPRNIQTFFDAIERARKAKGRERRS
jgi:hypothetical protein